VQIRNVVFWTMTPCGGRQQIPPKLFVTSCQVTRCYNGLPRSKKRHEAKPFLCWSKGRGIPRHLRQLQLHRHIHNSLPMNLILSKLNLFTHSQHIRSLLILLSRLRLDYLLFLSLEVCLTIFIDSFLRRVIFTNNFYGLVPAVI
jgi:hypothetical protein